MKSTFWVLVETCSTIGFQFLSIVVLSRILTPRDYGVFGMMAIFIAIGNMLVDSGMGGALIKKRNATDTDYSTLFCFNLIVSLAFYALLFLSSNYVANIYGVAELSNCLRIYGLFIIISAVGIVQYVQMLKELRYQEIAIISIVANIIAFVITIYLANQGWGYWALIIQHLAFILLRVLGQFMVNHYIPTLSFSKQSFKEQFSFGGSILLSNLLSTIYGNITSTIIPKISTLTQNGYYVQAAKIQGVPVSILTMVSDKLIFPVISKQPTQEAILAKSRRLCHWGMLACCILVTTFLFCSRPLILLFLGEKWLPALPFLQVLFLAAYGVAFIVIERNIIKAIGRTSLILKIAFYKSIVGLSIIFLSSLWGIMGILWGFVISSIIVSLISACVIHKNTAYSAKQQLSDVRLSLFFPVISFIYVLL